MLPKHEYVDPTYSFIFKTDSFLRKTNEGDNGAVDEERRMAGEEDGWWGGWMVRRMDGEENGW